MINIDYTSSKAIYEQIYDEITRLILSKALKPDDKLPSVRELAAMTKINPNTIQKAYKVLELENYIYSVKGRGNFVKSSDDLRNLHIKKLDAELFKTIKSLSELGLSSDDIIKMVNNILVLM
nr:GntR family transcriptional regulator [Sedimentibacter sp.]